MWGLLLSLLLRLLLLRLLLLRLRLCGRLLLHRCCWLLRRHRLWLLVWLLLLLSWRLLRVSHCVLHLCA